MSEGAPTQRLPRQVEPRKLAYNHANLSGVVKLENLPSLAETAQFTGDINVRLDFSIDEQGRRMVTGNINAMVSFECQRCLQMIEARKFEADVKVAIVWDEEESRQLPRNIDPWIVGEDEADVFALVEEELLLNIPVAAYHDFICIDESLLNHGDNEPVEGQGNNPFSVLAKMKQNTVKDESKD